MNKLRIIILTLGIINPYISAFSQNSFNTGIKDYPKPGFREINIDDATKIECFEISHFIQSAEVVLLEDSQEALISRISQICISEDYIAIFPNRLEEHLKLYTADGRFLYNIGDIGRGPNEYRYINGMHFSFDKKRIITEPANRKVFQIYDLSGEFINSIPRKIFGDHSFISLEDNRIIDIGYPNYARRGTPEPTEIDLALSNENDLTTKFIEPLRNQYQVRFASQRIRPYVYVYDSSIRIHLGQDTLYMFDAQKLSMNPLYNITSKKYGYDFQRFNDLKSKGQYARLSNKLLGKVHIEIICETSEYLLLKSYKRNILDDGWEFPEENSNFIYNKLSEEINQVTLHDSFWGLALNKRKYHNLPKEWYFYNNEYGIVAYQALDFLKEAERIINDSTATDKIKSKIENLKSKIDIESNMILFIYKLKD